tara:strand:+ start:260 stop:913 length:654 start_codon:yes stop_codon:yes gene_type:complete
MAELHEIQEALQRLGSDGNVLVLGTAVDWDTDEAAVYTIDVPAQADADRPLIVAVKNGSATVDLTATIGNFRKFYAAASSPTGTTTVYPTDTGDVMTGTAHGLVRGDKVQFTGTVGGVALATDYWLSGTVAANTFQFSTSVLGGAFTVTEDGTNACALQQEYAELTSFTIPAVATGELGIRDRIIQGWPKGEGGQIKLSKSADAAAAFYAWVEIRRL